MNTKIAKALIGATNPQLNLDELDFYASDIVQTNNHATQYGFIDLPMLDYHGVEYEDNKIIVSVRPKCWKTSPLSYVTATLISSSPFGSTSA